MFCDDCPCPNFFFLEKGMKGIVLVKKVNYLTYLEVILYIVLDNVFMY